MKKILLVAAVLVCSTACLRVTGTNGSFTVTGLNFWSDTKAVEAGAPTEQTRQIGSSYSGLSTSFAIEVVVSPDVAAGTVVVQAGKNVIDRVTTEVRNGRLVMGIEGSLSIKGKTSFKVLVPVQRYDYLGASGAGSITLPNGYDAGGNVEVGTSGAGKIALGDGFKAHALRMKMSGASKMNGNAAIEGDVAVEVSGASNVTLRGTCKGSLDVEASGASNVECGAFVCTSAKCEASGASKLRVNATKEIAASASGASRITCTGPAPLTSVKTSGASSISKL